ncbi:hypothetical protein JCM5296_004941 [Sporobolomyces johnsonii]
MRASTSSFSLVLALLTPCLASAGSIDFLDHVQHPLDVAAHRSAPSRFSQVDRPQGVPVSPSVVVHVVDPSSPSTSSIVMPSSLARPTADDDGDEQEDAPNFGQTCEFKDTFTLCGDYFDAETETDHGLFCSPQGVCGGKGAACGASEACSDGLVCNLTAHRCVPASASFLSVEHSRKSSRHKAALSNCPVGAEACSSGIGGFECVYTSVEVTQCGGCVGFGGRDCSAIPNALATSCRAGVCVVHACTTGYTATEDGRDCIDSVI